MTYMSFCEEGHDQIAYTSFGCPACELREELEKKIESLEEDVESLKEQVSDLKVALVWAAPSE